MDAGYYTASLLNSVTYPGLDTRLQVRTGGSCPGDSLVTYNDNIFRYNDLDRRSEASFCGEPNTTYNFLVGSTPDSEVIGDYQLEVRGFVFNPDINHDCSGSIFVTGLEMENGATYCSGDDLTLDGIVDSNEVVYTLMFPYGMTYVTVSLCDTGIEHVRTDFDTRLQVRMGGACPGDSLVAYNDDYGGMLQSQVTFYVPFEHPYYYVVIGGNHAVGRYGLVVNPYGTAPNDSCPGATITVLPFSDRGNTGLAYDNFHYTCGTADNRDVIYHLSLPASYEVTASLCGSSYNTQLLVRSGAPCPGSQAVSCDDNSCGQQSRVTFTAQSGQDYYLVVDGAEAYGEYVLNVMGIMPLLPISDLVVRRSGTAIVLNWTAAADSYRVYRGDVIGFPVDDAHRIATVNDTTYVDSTALAGPPPSRFYAVTAVRDW